MIVITLKSAWLAESQEMVSLARHKTGKYACASENNNLWY